MDWVDLKGSSPFGPAGRLRAAFDNHAIATGWPWAVDVRQPVPPAAGFHGGDPVTVQIDLSAEDARTLADLLLDAAGRADGPHSGDWISTARVAKMLDVTQSTIRGWVTRNGPKDNPFPQPDRSDSGRNFWDRATISKWRARQRRIDRRRREGR